MAKIFISYRREDTESDANHLKSELEKYVGKGKVFLDSKGIQPGRDWRDVLQRSVKGSDCLLALIGPKWLHIEDSETKQRRLDNPDDFVRQEIRGALKNKKMPVVPVLVGDARMPEPKDLPDELKELASRQNFELRQRRWEDDVRALAQELRLVSRSTLAKPKTGVKVAASLVPAALVYWLVALPAGPAGPTELPPPTIEDTVVEGNFLAYNDIPREMREIQHTNSNLVWIEDGKSNIKHLTLYGVSDVDPKIEEDWMGKHRTPRPNLSCRAVSLSYRCLAANTFDLSEALLLNGGAKALPDAPPSYRDAEAQARAAKRNMWKHSH